MVRGVEQAEIRLPARSRWRSVRQETMDFRVLHASPLVISPIFGYSAPRTILMMVLKEYLKNGK
jgi:hypothetical protein